MSWTNYHSHCHYCDGKYEPEQYVKSALQKGVISYGFSSHAPVPFDCTWTMKSEDAHSYIGEINSLKQNYKGQIQLYKGLEVDYIPGITGPKSKPIIDLDLDYTVGSIHFVEAFPDGRRWEIDGSHQVFLDGLHQIFKGDIKRAVKRYFELTRQMVEQECPDIIGHIDKIKIQDEEGKLFSTQENWYQKEVLQTLQIIADAGAMIEVNTRGIYKKKTTETYPSGWILEQIYKLGIPITLNSDAHHPDEIISNFQEAASLLNYIGFQHLTVLLNGTWQQLKFDKDGVKL